MIIDYRGIKDRAHLPLYIHGEVVESVSKQLTRTTNTSTLGEKEAQQRLFFSMKLKQAKHPHKVFLNFDRGTVETILTNCSTVCYLICTAAERIDLHPVVKLAHYSVRVELL